MSTTVTSVRDVRKTERGENDAAISLAQPLNERAADCANSVAEHLEKFGVPKSKRGARHHVVLSAPSTPEYRPRAQSFEEWHPQYPARRSLSDRAPFAHALSGYDPDRVSGSDYPWSVP